MHCINMRAVKIHIDILLLVFLVMSLIPVDTIPLAGHIISGSLFTVLFIVHTRLNKQWYRSVISVVKSEKINKKVKRRFLIDLLLMTVWPLAIITGIIAAILDNKESPILFIHIRLALWGLILIVIHLVQHWNQIRSYFSRKKKGRDTV